MIVKNTSFILKKPSLLNIVLGLWWLKPLSTIFQLNLLLNINQMF
jgi:hypothetical protein